MNKKIYFFLLCLAGVLAVYNVSAAHSEGDFDDGTLEIDEDLPPTKSQPLETSEQLKKLKAERLQQELFAKQRDNSSSSGSSSPLTFSRVDTVTPPSVDITKGTSTNPNDPSLPNISVAAQVDSVNALTAGTPASVTVSLPEQTLKTMRITLQNINEFIPLLAAQDQSAQFVPHAIRILELMQNFEKEVSPTDLQKLGVTQEFARTKLLLEKSINNKQIQVASKLLELYGTYESNVDADNSTFSQDFKTQALALFGNRVTSFTVQDAELQGYFTFKTKIQEFLQVEGTPDRVAFLKLVNEELKVALADETQLQTEIAQALKAPMLSGDADLRASFATATEALDKQSKQLQQESQNAIAGETVNSKTEPVKLVEPEALMNLLQGMKNEKGLSVVPDGLFEGMVKSLSTRVTQLQIKSAQLQSLADLLTSAVTARGFMDAFTVGGSIRNQNVQLDQIALKTHLDDVQSLANEIDADRKKIITVIEAAQGSQGITSEQSRQLVAQKGYYDSLLLSVDAQLSGYKKQLLTQQIGDFMSDSLFKQIMPVSEVNAEALRTLVAERFRMFELSDALSYGPNTLKKQIEGLQVFEKSVKEALVDAPTKEAVRLLFSQAVAPKGLLQEAVRFYDQLLNNELYGKDTITLAALHKAEFDRATQEAQIYFEKLNGSVEQGMVQAVGLIDAGAKGDVYDIQNKLYDALCRMQAAHEALKNMVWGLPHTNAKSSKELATGIDSFYNTLDFSSPFDKDVSFDTDDVVKNKVKDMLKAKFASFVAPQLEARIQQPVYRYLLEQIGKNLLGIDAVIETPNYYAVTDLEATRISQELATRLDTKVVRDWRYIPKSFVERVGSRWLTEQEAKEEGLEEMTFEDQKLLCLSWSAALRAVKFSTESFTLSDQPFRNIDTNLFSSPCAYRQYFEGFTKGYVNPDLNDATQYLGEAGKLATLLDAYQVYIASGSGLARTAVASLEVLIEPMLGDSVQDVGSSKDSVIDMMLDSYSLLSSLQADQSGTSFEWQKQLADQVQAVQKAIGRIVLAKQLTYAVTNEKGDTQQLNAIGDGMVIDQYKRIQEYQALIGRVQSGDVPTLSELKQLYVAKITLGLEQQLYNFLLKTDSTFPVSADIVALGKQLDNLPIPNPKLYQKLMQPAVVTSKKQSFLRSIFSRKAKK